MPHATPTAPQKGPKTMARTRPALRPLTDQNIAAFRPFASMMAPHCAATVLSA